MSGAAVREAVVKVYAVPEEDVEALLDISDEEFTNVVTDALMQANGPTAQEPDWQCLLAPEVVGRTAKALGQFNLQVQIQLGELSHKFIAEQLTASELAAARMERANLLLLRSRVLSRSTEARHLHKRLNIAKAAARATNPEGSSKQRQLAHIRKCDEEVRQLRNALRQIAATIQNHRLASIAAELAPEPQDRTLWALLDQIVIPYRTGTATLTEMLGQQVWTEGSPDSADGAR